MCALRADLRRLKGGVADEEGTGGEGEEEGGVAWDDAFVKEDWRRTLKARGFRESGRDWRFEEGAEAVAFGGRKHVKRVPGRRQWSFNLYSELHDTCISVASWGLLSYICLSSQVRECPSAPDDPSKSRAWNSSYTAPHSVLVSLALKYSFFIRVLAERFWLCNVFQVVICSL